MRAARPLQRGRLGCSVRGARRGVPAWNTRPGAPVARGSRVASTAGPSTMARTCYYNVHSPHRYVDVWKRLARSGPVPFRATDPVRTGNRDLPSGHAARAVRSVAPR
ncbi:hypothetical protein DZF91_04430 [Actinomadura logoneensis]|uniref:Uncharacterized protein n=1 Tax=Actinomadura logoneensis TaxID=2293572 RepID=A0A372JS16_9ACTN|nr:hypothetical protein DZF91_04430 [Actinomadura logoneensis]